MAEPQRYSNKYRSTETQQVMTWIKAGQCGCLVGLLGAGKSNFVGFLLHEETRRQYLGNTYPDFAFVFLDLLALTDQTDWAVYELILDRILSQLRPLIPEGAAQEIDSLHHEVAYSKNTHIAQRTLERTLDILCRQRSRKIALLLDAFDTTFVTLEPPLFRYLRNIRDTHKDQLCYLVITDKDLDHLREDLSEVEPFYRLVSRNVCYLGPYNETDARQMIHYLAVQRDKELSVAEIMSLIKLSGGHASLLKAILGLHWDIHEKDVLVEASLNNRAKIQAQCRRIWGSLSKNEQQALCALRDGRPIDRDTQDRLKLRGLVRPSQTGSNPLFSPLFSHFVQEQASPVVRGVTLNPATREAQIAGRRIDNLTELEFEVLCYFCERPGQVCTLADLIEAIYSRREKRVDEVNDTALLALISRLRKKIEPDPKRPRYLLTVRGQGYRFVEPVGNELPANPQPHVRGR